jgi:hypothetical protein
MKKFIGTLAILLVASVAWADNVSNSGAGTTNTVVQKLQDASVTIKAGRSQGSGVFVTRTVESKDVTFIITAGHVIDHLKKTRTVLTPEGKEVKKVEFDDLNIVQEFQENGRKVGEFNVICRVVRYSDAELGEDLAVLQVYKQNFTKATTEFYLDEQIPPIGTDLYHVGSLLGQVGSNSLTTGIISQTGRVLNLAGGSGVIFDQTTATAFPGSSGGGVYRKHDGLYVGTLVRGAGEGFNFIVPVRRLHAWCKLGKIEWLLDPKAKMPSMDEINKLSPSDIPDVRQLYDLGIRFKTEDAKKYPTLLNVTKSPSPFPFTPESPTLPE